MHTALKWSKELQNNLYCHICSLQSGNKCYVWVLTKSCSLDNTEETEIYINMQLVIKCWILIACINLFTVQACNIPLPCSKWLWMHTVQLNCSCRYGRSEINRSNTLFSSAFGNVQIPDPEQMHVNFHTFCLQAQQCTVNMAQHTTTKAT
jgi:hypothetical protein